MKKIVAMILAFVLVFALAACGDSTATNPSESPATSTTPEQTTQTTQSPQATQSTEPIEKMELLFTTSKNETSEMGDIIHYFCDYVTEASGGAITFNISWGGTLCSMPEELDMVGSGSADVCMLNPLPFSAQLPLAQAPNGTCNSYQGTADYAKYLFLENESTASLIQKSFEENGLHYVGLAINGNSGYYCTFEADSLEDMAGKKFGTGQSGALQREYGLNVISMASKDGYDSLQRGVVDCADSSMASAYTSSWAEVTQYWVYYNYVTYGNLFSINADKWNSWPENVQEIFNEAGIATLEYSVERISGLEEEIVKDVEDNHGITVTFVEDEEFALKNFTISATNTLANTAGTDESENMKTVVKAAADYLGFDVSELLAAN